jgi:hypothetical protein
VALALFLSGLAPVGALADPVTVPVDAVRPGQRGTVRTVLQGTERCDYPVEVLGVARNSLGPGRDLIIVQLLGEEMQRTGVAAGMSGSPVFVEGRLLGALAYRIGSFTREPIAGVTPFGYMLEIPAGPEEPPSGAVTDLRILHRSGGVGPDPGVPAPPVADGVAGEARPVATPILLSGATPGLVPRVGGALEGAGWVVTTGGGSDDLPRPVDLQGGDPVGAQLLRGDLSLTATGTVTAVEDGRVWAFGHPFLRSGAAGLPMTGVEVITTVASELSSFKMANTGAVIGTFSEDRFSGIAGRLGPGPDLIPVHVEVRGPGAEPTTYRYEMIRHPVWSPFLLQSALLNSLLGGPEYGDTLTLTMDVRLRVAGHGEVTLHEAYAPVAPTDVPAVNAAADAGRLTAALVANRFEAAALIDVEVTLEVVPERRYAVVESAHPLRNRVVAGESLPIRVVLAPYRGARQERTVSVPVPARTHPGPLEILVGSAGTLDRAEGRIQQVRLAQLGDLGGILSWIRELRSSDRLYVELSRRAPGALLDGRLLPDLPGSVRGVLRGDSTSGGVVSLDRNRLEETSFPVDAVLIGGHRLSVEVVEPAPDGRAEGGR